MKTVRIPGGLSVAFSGLESKEAYHRAMDSVSAVTGPLKTVLDVLSLAVGIKRVLEAAPGIPGDPSEFISRLRSITALSTQLAGAIPQFSVPVLLRDLSLLLVDLIQMIRDEIASVMAIATKKQEVQAYVAVDPALSQIVLQIEAQQTTAAAGVAAMMEPLALVLQIVDVFMELIGQRPLGASAAFTDSLSVLDAFLEGLQGQLELLR